MRTKLLHLRWLPLWLLALLILAMAPPFGAATAYAQGAPPACRDDQGNAVLPSSLVGGWVLVLNFNHPKQTVNTVACRVTATGVNPLQVSYTIFNCPLRDNVNSVKVGAGQAPFDGKFWIECAGGPIVPGQGPTYDTFYVFGEATFGASGATYTLMQHEDAEVNADVDANWHVKMRSRYGATTFEHEDGVTNVNGMKVSLQSQVAGSGTHFINGTQLLPAATVPAFPYNYNKPIRIGNPGQSWTLYQLIIDPPPSRCCFSP